MRRFLKFSVPVLAICLLANSSAFAQGRGPRGFGGPFGPPGGGGVMLLMNPQVQKELKLTDDQTAKVGEIQREAFQGGGPGQRGQNLSDEERQKRREEFQKRMEETNKKVLEVLSADQNSRLKQIQLWVGGVAGLARNEEAAKELKITDDQKEALKTITDESGRKGFEIGQGIPNANEEERTALMAKLTTLRKETETECEAVLTDEQKAQFAKMRGEKFELDMSQFGGFRGRGARGRPGNNN